MKPSRILKFYYLVTLVIGLCLSIPTAHWVSIDELSAKGAAIMTLCWNVLFILLLPIVLDWGERYYFNARFLAITDIAKTHPELATVVANQCKKLAIQGLRFAIINSTSKELFSYGLWRSNPRLVITDSLLNEQKKERTIPGAEAELMRFATQDHTLIFILFTIAQTIFQNLLIAFAC